MTSFCHQLKLLLWKNFLIRRRHKVRMLIEFIWPLILFLILIWVRTRGLKENKASCHHVPKLLPLSGLGSFEFFQNYLCTLNNPCHEGYIEEVDHLWNKSTISQIVDQAIPLVEKLLANNRSRESINQLWSNMKFYTTLVNGIRSRSENEKIGYIEAGSLMTEEGKENFLETAPSYVDLDRKELEEVLKTEINLNALNPSSLEVLLEDFRTGNCGPGKNYDVIKVPSNKTYSDLCQLGPQKAFLLLYIFTSFINPRSSMTRQIQSGLNFDRVLADNRNLVSLRNSYDEETLKSFSDLGSLLTRDIVNMTGIMKLINGTDPITTEDTVKFYKFMCGEAGGTSNDTIFGFEAESANRYDSLRDNLRDWNKEHFYENDPELSDVCNTIFMRIESVPLSAILWRQIKPFIRGSIFYTPNTTFTREIMDRVEENFEKSKENEMLVGRVITIIHRLRFWLRNNSRDVELLKELVDNPEQLDQALALMGITLTSAQKQQIQVLSTFITGIDLEKLLEQLDLTAEILSHLLTCVKYDKTKAFNTEAEAVEAAMPLLPLNKLWAVIVFPENVTSIAKHITYKIRMDSDKVDGTRYTRNRLTNKSPRRRPVFDLKYITNGFVYLQQYIEQSIIEVQTGESLKEWSFYLQQIPYPCYIHDIFIRAISRTFPFFMILSWIYAAAMIIKSIVLEKEKHLREIMKVMGIGNIVIWVGWFIDSFAVMSLSATVLSMILKWGKVIEKADFSLILVFMITFTVSAICFSFFISVFFSRANSAAAAGGIIFFVCYLPYNFILIWEERLTWYHMLFASLISNVAFGFGCNYFSRLEEDGVGAQWDRITLKTSPDDDFNLSYCIIMMWFDSFLYILLALYFEAVLPGAAGVPKPWYFLFQKSTWTRSKKNRKSSDGFPLSEEDRDILVEAEPEDARCGIAVQNLSKTYSNGKVALQNLNIRFFENQITSFLGHNGAGKTTTIGILTGLFPATSGTAYIYGLNIKTEMDRIRQDLGICPQFNVLFDRLTVVDHLNFFAGLKGKKVRNEEIEKMLMDLGIPEKRHEFPGKLSGGMKRKLSVAIAFVGGSRAIFIDEATTGVDPASRRSIWDLLVKYKEGRTIILTTHFMDEADLLGDRIAIISQGKLKTCGSSLFLKSNFGQGYTLHIVKLETYSLSSTPQPDRQPHPIEVEELESSIDGQVNQALLANKNSVVDESNHSKNDTMTMMVPGFIKFRIPEAMLVDDFGFEVSFLLPYTSAPKFSKLFNDLDDNLKGLGISSYGISDTTLEDVFLKITMEDIEHSEESIKSRRRLLPFGCCCRKVGQEFNKVEDDTRINLNGTLASQEQPLVPQNNVINVNSEETEVTVAFSPTPTNTGSSPNAPESDALLQGHHVDDIPQRNDIQKRSCCGLCCIQIWAIIMKRFRNSKRNLKAMFFEIILPAVFIALTLAFTLLLPTSLNEAPLEITPWKYPSPFTIFFSQVASENSQADNQIQNVEIVAAFDRIVDELVGPIGMGTACIVSKKAYGLCHPDEWSNASVTRFHDKRSKFTKKDAKLGKCSCSSGSQICDPDSEIEINEPPKLKTPTRDFIKDVSQYVLPEWIEKTFKKYDTHRYGGYQFQIRDRDSTDMAYFIKLIDSLTSPDANVTISVVDQKSFQAIKVWYENRGWVSGVAYLNALHNMMLREKLPDNLTDVKNEYGITLITHPLNLTKAQLKKESLKTSFLGVIHAVCVIFALSFVLASFTVYLIEERTVGGKHLHLVSSVKPVTYWIANFIYDMTKYLIPGTLIVLLFVIFDAKAYVSSHSIAAFILLLVLYGWASIPLMYPATYLFTIPSTAFVTLACTNLFLGVVTTVSVFTLETFDDVELREISNVLKQIFLIFPQYCLGRGLIELVTLDVVSTAGTYLSVAHKEPSRFLWKYLGKLHLCLLIQGFLFFLFNLACDYKQTLLLVCKRKPRKSTDNFDSEDEDVHRERERVLSHSTENSTLTAESLTKFYGCKHWPSVNSLCFSVNKGECFGLLGVNGAGKSTTFKMLTGDVRISAGKAHICGFDVEKHRDFARKHFGYCPQEDSLDPLLNGYEMLELYGMLRGMTRSETRLAGEKLITALGLTRYARRNCGTYSGGNKRKLNTAIALIGDPEVVFLDEPTSGMDPGARRQLWKVILDLVHMGKSIVLTTHSMEECEALCNRVGIMVNGKFVCLGSLQHLKTRFGKAYTLTVRCVQGRCEQGGNKEFLTLIHERLPKAELQDVHVNQLKFSIPQENTTLSHIFDVVQAAKDSSIIDDYSLSQTTLDDIFVRFASHQRDDDYKK